MPTPLIDESRYDEIRHKIDTSLGPANLPNEIISQDSVLGEAERWVEARTSDRGHYAKLAAIYYAAYLIAPSVPRVKIDRQETGSQLEVALEPLKDLLARLLGKAEEYIGNVQEVEPTSSVRVPDIFTLAHGCRGR